MKGKLTQEEKQRFEEDGFVILKNFLEPQLVELLRSAAEGLVSDLLDRLVRDGRLNTSLSRHTLETRLIRLKETNPSCVPLLFRDELHRPEFFELFGHETLLEVVSELLPDAEDIRVFPNYTCRPKLPDFDPHEIVWHQDACLAADGLPNTAPEADRLEAFGPGRTVNVWSPLVEATPTTGCLKVVPGSHRLGLQHHQLARRYRDQEEAQSYGNYATQIDPEVMAKHEACAVDLACSPGDIIFLSNLLFHRGGQNTSDIIRWSCDWRYQDAAYPTHRPVQGHVIWSRTNQSRVIKTANQWARLSVS